MSSILDSFLISCCDDNGLWQHLERQLTAFLPIRNVPWKLGQTALTIPILDLMFVPHNSKMIDSTAHPVHWSRKPFVYMFVAKCEDMDVYKGALKAQLKSWLDYVQDKQAEWFILYLPLGASSSRFEASSKTYRKIFDKIKSDFKVPDHRLWKHDLMSSDRDNNDEKNSRKLQEVLVRIKELALVALELRFKAYEEELGKIHANRKVPGWNFCSYLIIKETIGLMYERLGLLNLGLSHYDELEAYLTEHVLNNRNCCFERFGGIDAGDDSVQLLDTTRKPFREMTYTSCISELDYRQYLFSRQAQLLLLLNKPIEAVVRALHFIPMLFEEMVVRRKQLGSTSPLFASSWAISAANSVAESIDALPVMQLESADMAAKLAKRELGRLKGELYLFARRRLVAFDSLVEDDFGSSVDSSAGNGNNGDDTLLSRVLGSDDGQSPPSDGSMPVKLSLSEFTGSNTPVKDTSRDSSGTQFDTMKMSTPIAAATGGGGGGGGGLLPLQRHPSASSLLLGDRSPPAPGAASPASTDAYIVPSLASLNASRSVVTQLFSFRGPEQPILNPEETAIAKQVASNLSGVLSQALSSRSAYENMFMRLSINAAAGFKLAQRHRVTIMLYSELAEIHFKRERYDKAQPLLNKAVSQLMSDGWTELLGQLHSRLAECHKKLGAFVEYVALCLLMLAPRLALEESQRKTVAEDLVCAARSNLQSGFTHELSNLIHPLLHLPSPATASSVIFHPGEGLVYTVGATVEILLTLRSCFPIPVKFDKLCLTLSRPASSPSSSSQDSSSITPTTDKKKFPSASPLLPSSSSSSLSASDKVTFDCADVEIVPGENRITLQQKVGAVGDYSPDSIWLSLGQLRLAHSLVLDYEQTILSVRPGNAAAELTLRPVQLILGHRAQICILIHSHSDSFRTATLRMKSPTGLEFGPKCCIHSHSEDDDKEDYNVVSVSSDGWIHLPTCNPNTQLKLVLLTLPIQPSVLGLDHKIQAFFEYTRRTAERFSKTASATLATITPFTATHTAIPHGRLLFLHINLESQSTTDVVVLSHVLKTPTAFGIRTSPALNVSTPVLTHKQSLGLSYVLQLDLPKDDDLMEEVSPGDSVRLGLELTYKLLPSSHEIQHVEAEEADKDTEEEMAVLSVAEKQQSLDNQKKHEMPLELSYLYDLDVEIPSEAVVEITTTCPQKSVVGMPATFDLEVQRIHSSDSEQTSLQVRIEVSHDTDHWLLSGRCAQNIVIKGNGVYHATFLAIPVVPGYLFAPAVTIKGLPQSCVFYKTRGSRTLVMPSTTYSAVCTKI